MTLIAAFSNTLQKKLDKEISLALKVAGGSTIPIANVKDVTFTNFLKDKLLMIYLIQTGVSYHLFSLIQDYTPFTENDWSDLLDLSTKSLQRYKQSSKQFRPLQSEKIIEMAEVTSIGLDIFGDMDKFRLWLNTPGFALGNMKPIELLKDSYGKEMVLGELTRINYGIFA